MIDSTLILISCLAFLLPIAILSCLRRSEPVVLPMSSGVNVPPNTSAQIVGRPQRYALRPDRLIISNPSDWIVNDIRIGNRPQFSQPGDIPGEMFASTATLRWAGFGEVPAQGDFTLVVTYVGDNPRGASFIAGVLGTQRCPVLTLRRSRRASALVMKKV